MLKTVLAIAFILIATYISLTIAIHFVSMPFQQVAEVLNATSTSSNS